MFCDSDRNIIASLMHEACEGHCPECDACLDDPTLCDDCGWNDLATEDEPHDPLRCLCDTCAEDRSEHVLTRIRYES